jgi:hypothetical protein
LCQNNVIYGQKLTNLHTSTLKMKAMFTSETAVTLSITTRCINPKTEFNTSNRILSRSRDSSVGIATGYGLGGRSSIPYRGKIFMFSTASRPALGPTQPSIQWVSEAISTEVRRQEHETDGSFPSSAEVKTGGAIPSLPNTSS